MVKIFLFIIEQGHTFYPLIVTFNVVERPHDELAPGITYILAVRNVTSVYFFAF